MMVRSLWLSALSSNFQKTERALTFVYSTQRVVCSLDDLHQSTQHTACNVDDLPQIIIQTPINYCRRADVGLGCPYVRVSIDTSELSR